MDHQAPHIGKKQSESRSKAAKWKTSFVSRILEDQGGEGGEGRVEIVISQSPVRLQLSSSPPPPSPPSLSVLTYRNNGSLGQRTMASKSCFITLSC